MDETKIEKPNIPIASVGNVEFCVACNMVPARPIIRKDGEETFRIKLCADCRSAVYSAIERESREYTQRQDDNRFEASYGPLIREWARRVALRVVNAELKERGLYKPKKKSKDKQKIPGVLNDQKT